MTEESRERRRVLDHERYIRHRDERRARQKEYYIAHRAEILARVRLKRLGMYESPQEDKEAARAKKKACDRDYYRKNRDKKLAYLRSYRERQKCITNSP